jgi:hypothetical protein
VISELVVSYAWLVRLFGVKLQYIGQLEAVAAAAAYWTCPAELRDSYPAHFIDNQGALGAFVRAASTDAATAAVAHVTARRQLELDARVWFEYVASDANIADLPSRGKWRAAARLLAARFGFPVVYRDMTLPPGYELGPADSPEP